MFQKQGERIERERERERVQIIGGRRGSLTKGTELSDIQAGGHTTNTR